MQVNVTINIDDRIVRLAKRLTKRRMALVSFLALLAVSTYAIAVPNTFQDGETISAAKMNANFSALEAKRSFTGEVVVTGSVRSNFGLTTDVDHFQLGNDGGQVLARLGLKASSGDFYVGTENSNSAIVVKQNSNVGIGTAGPGAKLHVDSGGDASGAVPAIKMTYGANSAGCDLYVTGSGTRCTDGGGRILAGPGSPNQYTLCAKCQ